MSLTGSITVEAEIAVGSGIFFKLSAGVRGTLIYVSGYATINPFGVSKGYSTSGGKIEAYAKGTFIDLTFLDASITLFEGWRS